MKLTKTAIKSFQPKEKKYYIMDDGLDNFGVKVYPSGKKSYIVRVRFNDSKKEYVIADTDNLTLSDAKELSRDKIKQFKNGIDVRAEEKKEKIKVSTFRQCIDDYLPNVKPRTKKDFELIIKNGGSSWQKWLDKPIKEISEDQILKSYDKRAKIAQNQARLEMAYLRQVWNFHKKKLKLPESPTKVLNEERKGWSEKKVNTRRLDFETAPSFYKAVQQLTNHRDKNFCLFCYYTGMRSSEVKRLAWNNIDLKNRSLHLDDTKNGEPLNIPINSYCMAVIDNIKESNWYHKKYLFPKQNRTTGKIEPLQEHSHILTELKKLNVFWSPHDSRRGFIVGAGNCGCNTFKVKLLTNHRDKQDTHGNYQHYTVAELRETSQIIGDYLHKQLLADNVIQFKQRA